MFLTVLYYLLCSFASLFLLMSIAWIIQYRNGNSGIVDIFWGLSFPISVSLYLFLSGNFNFRILVLVFMIAAWGLRLALYLFGRNWNKEEDPRYKQLKKEWGNSAQLKMFLFYQFQALISSFLSIPFILIILHQKETLSVLELLAIALWGVGFVGETMADAQMKAFKKNNLDKKQVCTSGLWAYSRHPNYFFEWLIWVAYFLFALSSPFGWIAALSPLLMLHFLLNVTGIKYSEAHMRSSKGDAYRIYQETTSAFVPMPRKTIIKTETK